MVHAKQVRIGNYLFNTCRSCETIARVASVDDHQIGCGIEGVRVSLCYKFENYEPIPLTKKMLDTLPQVQALNIERNSDHSFFYTINTHVVEVKYLHQLQNLYFTVTGEEIILDFDIISAATTLAPATA